MFMQLFQDYNSLKQAENQLATLKEQRASGQLDLKVFYDTKKALENTIARYKNAIKPALSIHQKYTLSYLLAFIFQEMSIDDGTNSSLDGLRVFTEDYVINPEPDTVVILDGYDDEGRNEEGYTKYVLENQIDLAYEGWLVADVVGSYMDYKTEFDAALLIAALEYYAENDTFMSFD